MARVVLRSGDLVKIETQRFTDDYMLLDDVAGERYPRLDYFTTKPATSPVGDACGDGASS